MAIELTDDAERFASAIARRRRARERYTLAAPAGRAGDMAFAYAVQDRLASELMNARDAKPAA